MGAKGKDLWQNKLSSPIRAKGTDKLLDSEGRCFSNSIGPIFKIFKDQREEVVFKKLGALMVEDFF